MAMRIINDLVETVKESNLVFMGTMTDITKIKHSLREAAYNVFIYFLTI